VEKTLYPIPPNWEGTNYKRDQTLAFDSKILYTFSYATLLKKESNKSNMQVSLNVVEVRITTC
jgi:hypothetical protein